MRHYAFNVGDYAAATVHLSDAEDLAYRRLLDAYYAREAPLPADLAACCRIARATSAAARKAVDSVLREFFQPGPDGWRQKRCDAEIERWAAKRAGATAAINLRWNRERQAKVETERETDNDRTTDVIRTYNENHSDVIPPTNQEPRTTSSLPSVEMRERAASPPPSKRPTRLPADWTLPPTWSEWAQHDRRFPADAVARIAEQFADHWRGKGEARADWLATWRNWVRRERAPQGAAATTAKHIGRDKVADGIWQQERTHERPDDRIIDGTAERVA